MSPLVLGYFDATATSYIHPSICQDGEAMAASYLIHLFPLILATDV